MIGIAMIAGLAAFGVYEGVAGRSQASPAAAGEGEPAKVEPVGKTISRVVLTPRAAERLGIETVPVRKALVKPKRTGLSQPSDRTPRKVIPYSAVIYGLHGETWTYTNPEPLVFVRQPIDVVYVDGDLAILSEGPASGTRVVTVGVAELFGTEFGVGGH